MRERDIFIEALEQGNPSERAALLDDACQSDAELRERVEQLLAEHERQRRFILDTPPPGLDATQDHPLSESPGTIVGPYRLMQQIGEGGFGVVFMAKQAQPIQRTVALKIIKPGMDTRQVIARFEAERQALALMDHPNIARVYDAGTTDSGRPYFVMELVKGVPITEYCDQCNLTARERLELFISVCRAIQHAHQKGVIHRDLKPSNVMVTLHDDKPVPKVIDFGVSKAISQELTEKTLFTAYGQMIGTPMYMSPEQAQMSGLDVDTRSDIYSLGVLLYEIVTSTTPFDEATLKRVGFDEMRRMICQDEPLRPSARVYTLRGDLRPTVADQRKLDPRKLSQSLRGEVDWIVMKALEKDRNRRYESANALAQDIERFLNDEPVQACPPSTIYRFRKFARRHKAAVVMATVVSSALLLTVVGQAVSMVLITREQQATENALRAETLTKADLEQTLERERRDSYFHRIALADRELSVNNLRGALQLLGECPEDLREWEWNYLIRLCRVEPVILQDKTEVNSLAFSPDGERLASAGGDGSVKVWNGKTDQVIQTFNAHPGFVSSVMFHPDGKYLASTGGDQQVKVWDLTTGQKLFAGPCDVVHTNGTANAAAFSPDGRWLAAGSGGVLRVWDWRKQQILQTFAGHEKKAISVAFSRDGRRLASGTWGGSVRLWDVVAGGEPLCDFAASRMTRHPISALAFSPNGRRLATASFGRRVDVWDTSTGELVQTLPQSGMVLCVAFSPDGRRLVSAGEDKTVRVWESTTGREVLGLRGHTDMCGCVAFSSDGRRLASASKDGTIRVWDATSLKDHEGQEKLTFVGHTGEVWSLAISPDGQKIVSGGFGSPAKVWDADTGRVSAHYSGQRNVVFSVAWQPDGQRIASAGWDGELFTVQVWDAPTAQRIFTIPGVPQELLGVAFSPDGRYLVTGSANRTVQVWDARTGDPVGTLGTHGREVRGVVFSRDGRHLASASGDGVVKLWDATRLDRPQEARLTLRARVPVECLNVAFSPDGRRLATAGEENTVIIWDVQTGTQLRILRGHNGDVYAVAFSPDDGRWLASAGEDSTVKVWDSQTGRIVRSFRGHTGLVNTVAFSPDGLRLVSGSRDHTVKIWDVTQLNELPEDP